MDDENDMVISQPDGEPVLVGGGYSIQSFFLRHGGGSIMTTYNPEEDNDVGEGVGEEGVLKGGGKKNKKVADTFQHLAVPAGLFYINSSKDYISSNPSDHYRPHDVASDDLMDRLYSLVSMEPRPRTTQKTTRRHGHRNKGKSGGKRLVTRKSNARFLGKA